jgi:hypothetical protein
MHLSWENHNIDKFIFDMFLEQMINIAIYFSRQGKPQMVTLPDMPNVLSQNTYWNYDA